jgi:hypothetical protein
MEIRHRARHTPEHPGDVLALIRRNMNRQDAKGAKESLVLGWN